MAAIQSSRGKAANSTNFLCETHDSMFRKTQATTPSQIGGDVTLTSVVSHIVLYTLFVLTACVSSRRLRSSDIPTMTVCTKCILECSEGGMCQLSYRTSSLILSRITKLCSTSCISHPRSIALPSLKRPKGNLYYIHRYEYSHARVFMCVDPQVTREIVGSLSKYSCIERHGEIALLCKMA